MKHATRNDLVLITLAVLFALAACSSGGAGTGSGINVAGDAVGGGDGGALADGSVADGADGGKCGDNVCGAGETEANCPKDCLEVQAKPSDCLEQKCAGAWAQCKADPSCAGFISCASTCTTGECIQNCAQSADAVPEPPIAPPGGADQVIACGMQQACLQPNGGVCGDGSCTGTETLFNCPSDCVDTPKPVCGNGKCEDGEQTSCPKDCFGPQPVCGDGSCSNDETAQSCPKDCATDPISCAEQKCPAEFDGCLSVPTCAKMLLCMSGCNTSGCANGCLAAGDTAAVNAFKPLAVCADKEGCGGSQQPVCGDGQCNGGENPFSCPQDCGGGGKCGDGQCGPGENGSNCPQDCGGGSKCGNGMCEPGENGFNCPKDCGGGNTCGNGDCGPGENTFNCPKDCGQPAVCGDGVCQADNEDPETCPEDCKLKSGDAMIACAKENCPKDLDVCLSDPSCAKIISCMGGCKELDCYQACVQNAGAGGQAFAGLGQCIAVEGCLIDGVLCGNGVCEDGETKANCIDDCGGTDPDPISCVQNNCPKQLDQCLAQPACAQATECFLACDDDACFEKCLQKVPPEAFKTFGPLMNCAQQAGCTGDPQPGPVCGDGMCQPGESPMNCPEDCMGGEPSCEDKCGEFTDQWPCQCDGQCVEFGDCCPDYSKFCQEPGPVCGDGVCSKPMESEKSCPKDCSSGPKPCTGKADCGDFEVCCDTGDGLHCVASGQCG